MDWITLLQSAASGLFTGGAGAASTLLALFKDIKKRLDHLEKALGVPGSSIEARTGVYLLITQLDDQVKRIGDDLKKLRRDHDDIEENPPEWFTRAMNRSKSSGYGSADTHEFEQRMERKLKDCVERVNRIEDDFERLKNDLESDLKKNFVDQDTFDESSAQRAEEMRRVQENITTVNGFLRGVLAALGYVDSGPSGPQLPPAPPPPRDAAGPVLPVRRK